jgi:hypothetical protein
LSTASDEEVAELERRWMDAWRRRERATCASLLADDFLLTSSRGVLMDKAQWLDGAMGLFKCDEFRWEELRARGVTDDVTIVHARTYQVASVGGRDWTGRFLLTDVWVRRKGRWVVVARHGTGPLPEGQDSAE